MKCERLPDPAIESDLTTHLTLMNERVSKNIKEAVDEFQETESVNYHFTSRL
jgi:hypothetical protein